MFENEKWLEWNLVMEERQRKGERGTTNAEGGEEEGNIRIPFWFMMVVKIPTII